MSVISVRHVSKAQARSISIYPFDKQELYIYIKKKKKATSAIGRLYR